ncbi:hypothetical protein CWS72_13645 [Telmatospirillum siberiense]|uniref:Uncharacterized protein n=1 Tax=Telmatospirillum siberiense TaxID=382514 RepID=A0A2N3PU32_9PROT|nr:hypothetical protein CWS72_13645 [Telmatospirillum siberiense]
MWLRPAEPPPPPPAAPDIQDEASALAASKGLVWREKDSLSLRLKSGEILTLTDRTTCGDMPCPKELSVRYRYLGWNNMNGGYDLRIAPSSAPKMLLPYSDDDVTLVDSRHAERTSGAPLTIPPPPQAAETDESLAEWLTDITNGRNQGEAPLIASSHGKASRNGSLLRLELADGHHLSLTDDLICGQIACPQQVFRSYDYAGLSPDGRFHVVEEHWNEANAAILVDTRTGGTSFLLGVPKFAPNGRRAVASVTDLAWSAPRRLEVWSLSGAAPGIEFSLSAKDEDDTVYEVLGWADSDHVRLRRGPWAAEQRSPAMLAHDGTGWHMEASDSTN